METYSDTQFALKMAVEIFDNSSPSWHNIEIMANSMKKWLDDNRDNNNDEY